MCAFSKLVRNERITEKTIPPREERTRAAVKTVWFLSRCQGLGNTSVSRAMDGSYVSYFQKTRGEERGKSPERGGSFAMTKDMPFYGDNLRASAENHRVKIRYR